MGGAELGDIIALLKQGSQVLKRGHPPVAQHRWGDLIRRSELRQALLLFRGDSIKCSMMDSVQLGLYDKRKGFVYLL